MEWEGGILGVLEYGLRPDDVAPGKIRDAYRAVWDAYHIHLHAAMKNLEEMLP